MIKEKKHSHYFKPCPFDHVDVYRVLELFNVTNPELAHAIKKLLVAGGRGHKDIRKDIQEAIDSLERWIEMRDEELFVDNFSKFNIPFQKIENSPYGFTEKDATENTFHNSIDQF